MVLLVLLVLFILHNLIKKKSRDDTISRRTLQIYLYWWGGCVAVYSLAPFGFKVSFYAVFLLLLHIVSFIIGFYKIPGKTIRNITEPLSKSIEKVFFCKVSIVIGAISTLYVLTLIKKFFAQMIVAETLKDARADFYSGDMFGEGFANINNFILAPLNCISLLVFMYSIVKRKYSLSTLIAGIYILAYASLGGGRFGYILLASAFLFVGYCLYNINLKKYAKAGLVTAVLLYVVIVFTTAARYGNVELSSENFSKNTEKANEQIVSYAVGPCAAFNYALEHDYVSKLGGYKYGALTFASLEAAVNIIGGRIGMSIVPSIGKLADLVQDEPIDLTPEMRWNALYTSVLYYYCDAGIIGVVLFPFFFGMLLHILINRLYKKANCFSAALFLMFCQIMFYSPISYGFITLGGLFTIFMMMFMEKLTNKRGKQL